MFLTRVMNIVLDDVISAVEEKVNSNGGEDKGKVNVDARHARASSKMT